MYRHFGSRDGLLAEVLLQIYEESFDQQFDAVRRLLDGSGPISEDDVVDSVPLPHGGVSAKQHAVRSQVLAVAGTNPILRAKLGESLRTRRMLLGQLMNEIDSRLPDGVTLDREVLAVYVFNLNWQYNDLLGDWSVTNEQYRPSCGGPSSVAEEMFSAKK